ncbi:MAG: YidC/Oxa1 family membrane protein insertase [Actinomycetota bacterium]|nr:YidC/Oxa1 family membrane protein insertase [Actinomycetota bacterium]
MLFFANILQPLISVFEAVLKFFHNNLGVGWGLSIVLLTVLVRAFLVPLTVKQYRSMQALQAHQPELKALQAKYKEDKQRLNQEIMKFYKENKVNPLGSCLPLLAQFPVFISLYYLLRSDLRGYICLPIQKAYQLHHPGGTTPCGVHHGAQFLFIGDLTNKATGAVLIVLMVGYVVSQLFSSIMMSTAAMDPTQRKIMILMPLVFVFLFISFPAGVILYWITTNLWTIVQQVIVRRIVGPPPVPATAKPSGDDGGASDGDGGTKALRKSPPRAPKPTTDTAPGAAKSAVSGVGGLLRRRLEPAPEPSAARGASRAGPPPRSPRKKKKRSGRRR